jgi:ankyrin repeat protein
MNRLWYAIGLSILIIGLSFIHQYYRKPYQNSFAAQEKKLNKNGQELLFTLACLFGPFKQVELLFKRGYQPTHEILQFILLFRRLDVIKFFSSHNVSFNVQDSSGMTPLMWATDEQTLLEDLNNFLELLPCEFTQKLNPSLILKNTPLETIIQQLVLTGTNVNLQDNYGMTALMYATANNYHNMVKALLKSGTNPYLKDVDGNTALDIAEYEDNEEIIELLQPYFIKE